MLLFGQRVKRSMLLVFLQRQIFGAQYRLSVTSRPKLSHLAAQSLRNSSATCITLHYTTLELFRVA